MIKVVYGRQYHVLLCLINLKGGSSYYVCFCAKCGLLTGGNNEIDQPRSS